MPAFIDIFVGDENTPWAWDNFYNSQKKKSDWRTYNNKNTRDTKPFIWQMNAIHK